MKHNYSVIFLDLCICSLNNFPYLEWINVSAFSASVNQESVNASISARSCSQASLLAGPNSPENQQKAMFELAHFCKQLQKFQNLAPTRVVGLVEKPQSVFVDTHFHSPFPPSNPAICPEHFYCGITSDVVFVGGVNFFYSSVAEGQLSHPVHSSSHTGCQTQICTGGGGMEAVCTEVICAKVKETRYFQIAVVD